MASGCFLFDKQIADGQAVGSMACNAEGYLFYKFLSVFLDIIYLVAQMKLIRFLLLVLSQIVGEGAAFVLGLAAAVLGLAVALLVLGFGVEGDVVPMDILVGVVRHVVEPQRLAIFLNDPGVDFFLLRPEFARMLDRMRHFYFMNNMTGNEIFRPD